MSITVRKSAAPDRFVLTPALSARMRDEPEGDGLVGRYPTGRARPGCLVALAHLLEQIRREAFQMVSPTPRGHSAAIARASDLCVQFVIPQGLFTPMAFHCAQHNLTV